MNKFKVGDKVVGNKGANQYSITNEGWTGVVTKLGDSDRNSIYVKPLDNPDHEGFEVLENFFDLKPANLTKEETLNLLSTQHDCFYSLPQVVEMIKNIEDPKPEPVTPGMIMLKEADYDSFLDKVRERLKGNFCGSGDNFIDLGTAEFSLNGNEIELDFVELYSAEVVDTAMECLENVLNQYVVVLEKSEILEA